jgi:hypothetical protein
MPSHDPGPQQVTWDSPIARPLPALQMSIALGVGASTAARMRSARRSAHQGPPQLVGGRPMTRAIGRPVGRRRGSSTNGMAASGDSPPASPPTPPADRVR